MSWRDLIEEVEGSKVYPWIGGRVLLDADYTEYRLEGKMPREHGWYSFKSKGMKLSLRSDSDPEPEMLLHKECGYLVGNRFLADNKAKVDLKFIDTYPEVFLIELGLDRFSRVSVGRVNDDGPLIYIGQEMPLGPEQDVLNAFLDRKATVDDILGVTPALDAAFRMETHQRVEAERRRLEDERRRQELEEQRQREENRRKLVEQLGDGAGRRAMARVDFSQAARAALAVGGAELLDHKRAAQRGEMVVRFRLNARRFECTCNELTLQIIDSGICLTAHNDDDGFEEGTKGDSWLSLESLPGVILEAEREGKLVVFRHVH